MQLTLPGFSVPIANEIALAVLEKFAPEKLMTVTDKCGLLDHCQRGSKPDTWYWWHRCKDIASLQMPELFEILEQQEKLNKQLQALTVEEKDAATN